MGYAENTTVSVERTRAEIERLIQKCGATGFVSGWSGNDAALMFEAHGKRVKFILSLACIS